MVDLPQQAEPYDLEPPYGVRVTARPLTTAGIAAAQTAARRLVEAIERQARERTAQEHQRQFPAGPQEISRFSS